ncbi:hypothetical protein H0H87_008760, partial [Tephrocybe sp. NHM501043]
VALFSAVVSTFVVQSLSKLDQDPSIKTNELLTDLIETLLAAQGKGPYLGVNKDATFTPPASVIRANFCWSLSLISCISVACVAVTARGIVERVSRSKYTQAYQRVPDLAARWKRAGILLGPTVDALPALLAPPVILFLVGLFDTLVSASLPISSPSMLTFIAAVACCPKAPRIPPPILPTLL